MKHGLWLRWLAMVLQAHPGSVEVVDTHAGAGLYDLRGPMPRKSGEFQRGIERLMAADGPPESLSTLRAAVAAHNRPGELRFYPGSPILSVAALRAHDRYRGWELRQDDQVALQRLLDGRRVGGAGAASALFGDGYQDLGRGGGGSARVIHIDPPFERGDEAQQIVRGVGRALRAPGGAAVAVWAPLKDLETFDSLLRAMEALSPRLLIAAEVRLRPLSDPMRLNGSAMIFLNGPDLSLEAAAVCDWVASGCGDEGAVGRVRRLAGS